MELNPVLVGKLFVVTNCAAETGKTRSSPVPGATLPNQLTELVQSPLTPFPVQIRVAPDSSVGIKTSASKLVHTTVSREPTGQQQKLREGINRCFRAGVVGFSVIDSKSFRQKQA